jgi:hypothetical protein
MFAARRDFELLKLLSTDRKALRVARVLGLPPSPHQQQAPVQGASKTSKGGRTRAQARSNPMEVKRRPQRRSQKERKLRQASASKLQALVVGFLTRRKELPAARAMAFRRFQAEAATRAVVVREDAEDAAARVLATVVSMDVPSQGRPKRPAELVDKATGRRVRPASPLASSASSYASCVSKNWTY